MSKGSLRVRQNTNMPSNAAVEFQPPAAVAAVVAL